MIIRLVLITILAFIGMYNLIKYIDIKIKAQIETAHIVAFVIVLAILFASFIFIFHVNIANYLLALVFVLYYVSSIMARGINKYGIYDKSFIIGLARLSKWNEVDEMKFEYNADNYIDVVFVTKKRVIRQRFDESYESSFLKIKKDLKI